MEQGKDGYPKKDYGGNYHIASGEYGSFNAKKIEIFGVNI